MNIHITLLKNYDISKLTLVYHKNGKLSRCFRGEKSNKKVKKEFYENI